MYLFNQPSILRDNLSPFSQKYFEDFLANIDMNNRHIDNKRSACQTNVLVSEGKLFHSCNHINFPQGVNIHTHLFGIRNPKYHCKFSAILQTVLPILKLLDIDIFFNQKN